MTVERKSQVGYIRIDLSSLTQLIYKKINFVTSEKVLRSDGPVALDSTLHKN